MRLACLTVLPLAACFERAELCNGRDDDRDGVIDDASVQARPHLPDLDGDGFGDRSSGPRTMCPAPGWVEAGGDCDDRDPTTFPGSPELCDAKDNDCDGTLPPDEIDADRDGYAACNGDCDDADPGRSPGRPELCDGLDQNCDGSPGVGERDIDGDGSLECAGDCDPLDPAVRPGAREVCDGKDNDCDGEVEAAVWPADADALRDLLATGTTERICLGPGTWEGPFDLGSGAWVTGTGPDSTTLVAADGEPLVTVAGAFELARVSDLTLDVSGGGPDSSTPRVGWGYEQLALEHVHVRQAPCGEACGQAVWVRARALDTVTFSGEAGGPLAVVGEARNITIVDAVLGSSGVAVRATQGIAGFEARRVQSRGGLLYAEGTVVRVVLEDVTALGASNRPLVFAAGDVAQVRAARIELPSWSGLMDTNGAIVDADVQDVTAAGPNTLIRGKSVTGLHARRVTLANDSWFVVTTLLESSSVGEVSNPRVLIGAARLDPVEIVAVDLRAIQADILLQGYALGVDGLVLAEVHSEYPWFNAPSAKVRHLTAVRSSFLTPAVSGTFEVQASTFLDVTVPATTGDRLATTGAWNNRWASEGLWWDDGSGGLQVDPLHVRVDDGPAESWDLRLAPGSPLIDAGPPDWESPDDGRVDIGAYGGGWQP